jgi:hypothetical protein
MRTKNLNLKTFYSPKHKISVIEITFEDILNKNKVYSPKSKIRLKVFVTSFRKRIVDENYIMNYINSFFYRLVCELNSTEYFKSKTNASELIHLSLNSEKIFKLKPCNLCLSISWTIAVFMTYHYILRHRTLGKLLNIIQIYNKDIE